MKKPLRHDGIEEVLDSNNVLRHFVNSDAKTRNLS